MEIKINKLRSLDFKEFYKIKPINAIIGENSSGKSTFLRFFPLIKQSIEKQTSSPILWYGQYVDFGSFEESVFDENLENEISISFIEQIEKNELYGCEEVFRYLDFDEETYKQNKNDKIKFEYEICMNKDKISSIIIKFDNREIKINNNKEKPEIYVNNMLVLDEKEIRIDSSNISDKKLLDISVKLKNIKTSDFEKKCDIGEMFLLLSGESLNEISLEKIIKIISEDSSYLIKEETYKKIAKKILKVGLVNAKAEIIKLFEKSQKKLFIKINEDKNKLENICNIVIANKVNVYINIINRHINSYFSNIDYIGPLRARAERYYRYQNLSVESIDPKGENIPTLINNLNEKKINNLNKWLIDKFGFEIENIKYKGNNSLSIRDNKAKLNSNIMDVGFGFSQIIPILIQLWIYSNNKKNSKNNKLEDIRILIIEQPELHLHPALQVKLIDTICTLINESKKSNLKLYVIFETHSETIINRIHNNIIKEVVNSDDVNISVFEKTETKKTKLFNVEIKENGEVVNWPYGFFTPEI